MGAGFTRDEALGVYLAELPHMLRAMELHRIDKTREQMFTLSLIMADGQSWKRALDRLQEAESKLGRRLPSAMDKARDAKVKQRLQEIRARLKEQRNKE